MRGRNDESWMQPRDSQHYNFTVSGISLTMEVGVLLKPLLLFAKVRCHLAHRPLVLRKLRGPSSQSHPPHTHTHCISDHLLDKGQL